MKPTEGLDINQLYLALEKRYEGDAWAFFREMRNCTGFSSSPRSADAVAFSLWPSRGLELHGFECKVTRSDWLRELAAPAKVEHGVYPYCDRWWVVVGHPSIVELGEVPPTWGLMIPRRGKLVVTIHPPKLQAQPMDRHFLAAFFRRAKEYTVPKPAIAAKIKAAMEEGKQKSEHAVQIAANRAERAESLLERFQEATGLRLGDYHFQALAEKLKRIIAQPFSIEETEREVLRELVWAEERAGLARKQIEEIRQWKAAAVPVAQLEAESRRRGAVGEP